MNQAFFPEPKIFRLSRPEAARGAGDRGWQSDGRIDVGGADCGEIGAASTEPVDKAESPGVRVEPRRRAGGPGATPGQTY